MVLGIIRCCSLLRWLVLELKDIENWRIDGDWVEGYYYKDVLYIINVCLGLIFKYYEFCWEFWIKEKIK